MHANLIVYSIIALICRARDMYTASTVNTYRHTQIIPIGKPEKILRPISEIKSWTETRQEDAFSNQSADDTWRKLLASQSQS